MHSMIFLLQFVFVGAWVDQNTWSDTLAQAEEEDKTIIVLFSATWCGPCKLLKKNTLNDTNVKKFLDDKVVFKEIDGEKGEGISLVKKYRVIGYPTLLIVDASGDVIDKKMGFATPSEFLRWVRHSMD